MQGKTTAPDVRWQRKNAGRLSRTEAAKPYTR